ncbi:MAG TPA: sigma-70 family RNA polymerase sigma factor [Nannocystaceae bacterium]|nr:sigma-70 family RNA polymerase sigma factor [Nannocystaceae bacterium]
MTSAANPRTDAELVDAWRSGDRQACESLFHRHYAAVTRFFRNKAPAHTSDLAQRTFLTCFRRIEGLREPDRFKQWALAVANNVLREHLRASRRDRIDFTSMSVADLGSSAVSIVARQREQRLLLDALRNIPVDLQTALELHYWERMTVQEIAETLEIPLGTAKSRLRRARELVGELMMAAREGTAPQGAADLDAWAFEVGRLIEPDPE